MLKSRRVFLKNVAAGSAAIASASYTSGCASIDKWVLGEGHDDGQMVTIIGGGLAGLSAAYTLKKNQIPFRLYEGSSRVGGRVLSLSDVNISSTPAELGAERIDSEHKTIIELAKELRVKLEEVDTKEAYAFNEKGVWLNSNDWQKNSNVLSKVFQDISKEAYGATPQILNSLNREQFLRAEVLDRMSADELIARLQTQLNSMQKNFLIQLVRTEWGVEPQELSALHLIHFMRDQFRGMKKKYYRISGGNSLLTQAMLDRIYGIIPDQFVRFGYQLVQIKPSEEGWRLSFRTKDGVYRDITAHRIISALPAAQLRKIEGWQYLNLTNAQKDLIENMGFAGHGKVILGFDSRPWQNSHAIDKGGIWLSDINSIQFSESEGSQAKSLGGLHGIIQAQLGGSLGEQVGLHSVSETLKTFEKLLGKSGNFENISFVHNWQRHPWTGGSRPFLKPGQFQKMDPYFTKNKESVDVQYPFVLAGDCFSQQWLGTMNGAVSSGIESARLFVAK